MDWYPWIKLLHVVAAFAFVLAHGASAFAAIRIRGEREPARVAALLDPTSCSPRRGRSCLLGLVGSAC